MRTLGTRRIAEPGEVASFAIEGRLPGLNEYTRACRANRHAGAKMKHETEELVGWAITQARLPRFTEPVTVRCTWHEKDERRDPDNVMFGVKFILDACTSCGVILGDGRSHVLAITHEVLTDRVRPHIDVTITGAGRRAS